MQESKDRNRTSLGGEGRAKELARTMWRKGRARRCAAKKHALAACAREVKRRGDREQKEEIVITWNVRTMVEKTANRIGRPREDPMLFAKLHECDAIGLQETRQTDGYRSAHQPQHTRYTAVDTAPGMRANLNNCV